ncbi:hypothetical protein [Geodermatophilus maliterrae]|uniref:Uncharacterized protein n=1 Tax=Geodermatophilus maliterrae TaxID=3162531 RepID=A0ABV3XBN7_9ACTN
MTRDDVPPARPAPPAADGELSARLLAFLLVADPPPATHGEAAVAVSPDAPGPLPGPRGVRRTH